MDEILLALRQNATVLDLGSGFGSFPLVENIIVVRIDLDTFGSTGPNFVQGDAANLPFANQSFDAVISNHSLEHFQNLSACLGEIGRVIKPCGALYVAVPDATTFTDRLYRWLANGGGHVNPFKNADHLTRQIESATGLNYVARRTLCTSLSFLNKQNLRAPAPKRLMLLGGGTRSSLLVLTYLLRSLDRFLGTHLSVYGWAFSFGSVQPASDTRAWTNVCIQCGSGHPSEWLFNQRNIVKQNLMFSTFRCPNCNAINLFTEDKHYGHLTDGNWQER